jgi:hypothetical protein
VRRAARAHAERARCILTCSVTRFVTNVYKPKEGSCPFKVFRDLTFSGIPASLHFGIPIYPADARLLPTPLRLFRVMVTR